MNKDLERPAAQTPEPGPGPAPSEECGEVCDYVNDEEKHLAAESRIQLESELARDEQRQTLQRPFLRTLTGLLFLLTLVLTVGFGIFEVVRMGAPQGAGRVSNVLMNLLVGALFPGVPLLIISGVQLARHRSGKLGEEPGWYRLSILVVLALYALLLAGWVVALALGR